MSPHAARVYNIIQTKQEYKYDNECNHNFYLRYILLQHFVICVCSNLGFFHTNFKSCTYHLPKEDGRLLYDINTMINTMWKYLVI